MADSIINNIPSEAMDKTIEKIELSKIGKGPDDKAGYFMNIFLKESFIHEKINYLNTTSKITIEKPVEKVNFDLNTVENMLKEKSFVGGNVPT